MATAKGGNRGGLTPTDGVYDTSSVTPNDGTDLPDGPCRGIWVGVAGDIKITTLGGTAQVLKNAVAGTWHAMGARRIWAAGTTATDIVAGY